VRIEEESDQVQVRLCCKNGPVLGNLCISSPASPHKACL
jgi:hypothetical protein